MRKKKSYRYVKIFQFQTTWIVVLLFLLCRDRISIRDEYHAREKNTCENKRFLRETSFHQWEDTSLFSPSPIRIHQQTDKVRNTRFNVSLFRTIHIFITWITMQWYRSTFFLRNLIPCGETLIIRLREYVIITGLEMFREERLTRN